MVSPSHEMDADGASLSTINCCCYSHGAQRRDGEVAALRRGDGVHVRGRAGHVVHARQGQDLQRRRLVTATHKPSNPSIPSDSDPSVPVHGDEAARRDRSGQSTSIYTPTQPYYSSLQSKSSWRDNCSYICIYACRSIDCRGGMQHLISSETFSSWFLHSVACIACMVESESPLLAQTHG